MSNHVLVQSFALASLLIVPACVDGVDDHAELDDAEATLSSLSCPADTPASIAPAIDQHLAFVLDATGVQRYACRATATGAAWAFVAPIAELFDSCGRRVGTHYAGPTWEHEDGSTVVAALAAAAPVDAAAIPWLLLSAVSHGGPTGKMTRVTSIQRLVTSGGLAPTAGCDAAHLGATTDVPYEAQYLFYRKRTKHMEDNLRCGATD